MPKTARKYKDSGSVQFEATIYFRIPRRRLKALFDERKAATLSELAASAFDRRGRAAKVRRFTFKKFLAELESQFQCAYEEGKFDLDNDDHVSALLDWAEEEFEESVP